jgi:hypothetical protein
MRSESVANGPDIGSPEFDTVAGNEDARESRNTFS